MVFGIFGIDSRKKKMSSEFSRKFLNAILHTHTYKQTHIIYKNNFITKFIYKFSIFTGNRCNSNKFR